MKQISLPLGSPAPTFAPMPLLEAPHTASGENSSFEKRSRSHLSKVARSSGETNLPINPGRPNLNNKAIRRPGHQVMASLPGPSLHRLTQRGMSLTLEWSASATVTWMLGTQPKVSWPTKDAYGTANDPAPEIRSHMRAILGASTGALGFAHA